MMNRTFHSIAASAIIALSVCMAISSMAEEAHRTIIIDTDMGLDDVRAVFVILAEPAVDIEAFISIEGSASLGKGTDNLIGLLEKMGAVDAPVLKGRRYAEHEPPRWRGTANSLAGHPFPPPRDLTAKDGSPENIIALIDSSSDPIDYLALGPIGNLALMEGSSPGSLGRLASIWIPVSIHQGEAVEAWNLSFDPGSIDIVAANARNIIFIDIASFGIASGPDELLGSVHGDGIAAHWIEEICSSAGSHLMLYDELAALAMIRPDMISIGHQRHSLIVETNGPMRLEADHEGSVRVARFVDSEKAAGELVRLWESGGGASHMHQAAEPIEPGRYIKAFHGHLGPYLVLGYRMGRQALAELDSPGHFGVSVVVHSALEPPRSCLIDGIQLGSGCTLGKRNIEVAGTDGPAYAVFKNDRGLEVTIRLHNGVPALIGRLIEESGVEEAGALIMEMRSDDLFEITRPASRPAP